MALIRGTKRGKYTKDKVQQMRTARILSKPTKEGITQEFWDMKLGKLQAAGHLRINGFTKMELEKADHFAYNNGHIIKRNISFLNDIQIEGAGERPHLEGYLESASNADKKPYRIKGWFNEDGTVRLELVE